MGAAVLARRRPATRASSASTGRSSTSGGATSASSPPATRTATRARRVQRLLDAIDIAGGEHPRHARPRRRGCWMPRQPPGVCRRARPLSPAPTAPWPSFDVLLPRSRTRMAHIASLFPDRTRDPRHRPLGRRRCTTPRAPARARHDDPTGDQQLEARVDGALGRRQGLRARRLATRGRELRERCRRPARKGRKRTVFFVDRGGGLARCRHELIDREYFDTEPRCARHQGIRFLRHVGRGASAPGHVARAGCFSASSRSASASSSVRRSFT